MGYFRISNKGLWSFLLFVVFSVSACTKNQEDSASSKDQVAQEDEPERIEVQHILIAFKDSLPGRELDRSKEEAEELAQKILKEAQSGKDFDALVKAHTDDRDPGVYALSNHGITPVGEEFGRAMMVPAFGDVGFRLDKGEIALAPYDKDRSPYGYHIIKRLR